MDWLIAGAGLTLLIIAGDFLVKGAVNLSLRLGIPAMIVSLTVVAFGTSAPELLISIDAVRKNLPGIALGNVVGSNTANILLVLGIPAMLAGLNTGRCNTRESYVTMVVVSVLFVGLCFTGSLNWMTGIFMLVIFAFLLGKQIHDARAHRRQAKMQGAPEGADPGMSWGKIALFIVVGLIGLPVGADLLVESSVRIARNFGISETVIGLTLVAVGTSLPELATTVAAAFRRNADVALGNVIGSNVFNLIAILGIASLFGTIPVPPEFLRTDLWVMLGSSLLLIPFVFMGWNMKRLAGIVLTGAYIAYLYILLG
ncbi:calcium/sodium antiporter [Qingshengfaniella alkalisoli]|uniref:Calcium/sodium antiporter n=1 Tax=Qingshengfaniella alkalisoli TaxID=2599296 RepID=A0A5B8IXZ5_9RHOB|nr:calcium/sodium antiporter [Qingshengfaniella alkalisoli]QDY69761.1 calcium/sodium antiporter [Qingshengfaniella alkalisoli]